MSQIHDSPHVGPTGGDGRLTAEFIVGIRDEFPDCFACGHENPHGLHLDPVALDSGRAVAAYEPTGHHGGAGDVLHGGLAATALDEIMVWAAIVAEHVLTVTATMEVRYRRPVRVTDSIRVEGRVLDRSGRRLRCEGSLVVGDEVAVTGSGLYLVVRDL